MRNHRGAVAGAIAAILLLGAWNSSAEASVGSRLGLGAFYNATRGGAEESVLDKDYFSYVVSLRQKMGAAEAEFSVDYYPGAGAVESVVRPFACLIWGDLVNIGLGVSRAYVKMDGGEGEWGDISYQLQGGLSFPLSPDVRLNIDAFYFANKLSEVRKVDVNYLTLGARVFFRF